MEKIMESANEINQMQEKLEQKIEEKIGQQNEERKLEGIWKETVELKTKVSTIEQSQARLFQMFEQMMTQLTKIEILLDQAIIEEESDSDSEEQNETVRVEIVTQDNQQTNQQDQQANQQTQQKSLIKKILLG